MGAPAPNAAEPLLTVSHLKKYFPPRSHRFAARLDNLAGVVKAVDDISFEVYPGEALALVGESGCGKSTTGETILYLQRPTSGEISFEGQAIGSLSTAGLRQLRQRMQMVFQNPYSSLNPRMRVGEILAEPLRTHGRVDGNLRHQVGELLEMVQLDPDMQNRYPHEFSGGQRQRIGIARALALRPSFIVLDEPVSALDVSVQAQIINLLKRLQREFQLTYLFISHDLRVVRHISDRVAVMYLGKIVEIGPTEAIFTAPQHPYTRALLSAIPRPHPRLKPTERIILEGEIPSPTRIPPGCRFHTRCFMALPECREVEPQPIVTDLERHVACIRVQRGEPIAWAHRNGKPAGS